MARRTRSRGVAVIVPTVERGDRQDAREPGARRADVWGWLRDNPAGEGAVLTVERERVGRAREERLVLLVPRGGDGARVFGLTRVAWPSPPDELRFFALDVAPDGDERLLREARAARAEGAEAAWRPSVAGFEREATWLLARLDERLAVGEYDVVLP